MKTVLLVCMFAASLAGVASAQVSVPQLTPEARAQAQEYVATPRQLELFRHAGITPGPVRDPTLLTVSAPRTANAWLTFRAALDYAPRRGEAGRAELFVNRLRTLSVRLASEPWDPFDLRQPDSYVRIHFLADGVSWYIIDCEVSDGPGYRFHRIVGERSDLMTVVVLRREGTRRTRLGTWIRPGASGTQVVYLESVIDPFLAIQRWQFHSCEIVRRAANN